MTSQCPNEFPSTSAAKRFYQVDETRSDTWMTPRELLAKLGPFDLDPCSPVNRPWDTAAHHYTIEDDGLKQPWVGRVFVNPPYSGWVPFLKRLAEHGNGIALIFARTETEGFFQYVWPCAQAILFIKRRVRFCRADGSFGGGSTAPSVLIAYGQNNVEVLRGSGIEGKLVVL